MARPTATVPLVRTAGADVVILLDGSASMRVRDVGADRWQRSVQFLRTLGESLRWKNDRIALALFAHVAEPQIRLTKDPNTYFFFLDHLDKESPFRLEDDPTWDTNIEQGIFWGVRLIARIRSPWRRRTRAVRPDPTDSRGRRVAGDGARARSEHPGVRRRRRHRERRLIPEPRKGLGRGVAGRAARAIHRRSIASR